MSPLNLELKASQSFSHGPVRVRPSYAVGYI